MVKKKGAPESQKHLGHGICDNISKSTTMLVVTDDCHVIAKECITLLQNMNISPSHIRGMGIQMGKLVKTRVTNKGIKTIDFSSHKARPVDIGTSSSDVSKSIDISSYTMPGTADSGNQVEARLADSCVHAVSRPVKTVAHSTAISTTLNMRANKAPAASDSRVSTRLRARNSKTKSPRKADKKATGANKGAVSTLEKCMTVRATRKFPLTKCAITEPPLPSLFVSPDRPKSISLRVKYDLPSPSQVDPSVFNALPDDVRWGIEDAYTASNLKLNVCMLEREKTRDGNGTESALSAVVDTREEDRLTASESTASRPSGMRRSCKKARNETRHEREMILAKHSSSTIETAYDASICEQPIKSLLATTDGEPASQSDTGTVSREGTDTTREHEMISRVSERVLREDRNAPREAKEIPRDIVLSYSQIDPTVLNELPEELRREIMQNLKFEERRKRRKEEQRKIDTKLDQSCRVRKNMKGLNKTDIASLGRPKNNREKCSNDGMRTAADGIAVDVATNNLDAEGEQETQACNKKNEENENEQILVEKGKTKSRVSQNLVSSG